MTLANKISPFLWFDGRAKEAANFYVSVFKDANILNVSQLEAGPPPSLSPPVIPEQSLPPSSRRGIHPAGSWGRAIQIPPSPVIPDPNRESIPGAGGVVVSNPLSLEGTFA